MNGFIVTIYLEIANGDKYTWVNHSITKKEEIEWILNEARKVLEKSFDCKDKKEHTELDFKDYSKKIPISATTSFYTRE